MTGPVKRSMMIAGHATSISLEPIFWDALREAAEAEQLPLNALVARIDAERVEAADPANLASAIRVWLFERARCRQQAVSPASSRGPPAPADEKEKMDPGSSRDDEHRVTALSSDSCPSFALRAGLACEAMKPVLFDYVRSTAAYRVRIALNLKGIDHERVQVNLLEGAQKQADYRARNPQGLVPMLEIDGRRIGQSLAIIDYLDATRPEPKLLPDDPGDRAQVLAMALGIVCDIHPLNNLRVLKYLSGPLGQPEEVRNQWYSHWVAEGFAALETIARDCAGRFLYGDTLTLADACLVPQMFNARRFNVPVDAYPILVRIDAEASRLPAFAAAHPDAIAAS
jgi:maleylacetoacetate isomerase